MKNMKTLALISIVFLFASTSIAEENSRIITEKQDWATIATASDGIPVVFSLTTNNDGALFGAICEPANDKFVHKHVFTPSFQPNVKKSAEGFFYVDVYLKAGQTEFDFYLLADTNTNGAIRLFYPTEYSSQDVIKRFIEARDVSFTYEMSNGKKVKETFSLMGYTHNVVTSYELCQKLNNQDDDKPRNEPITDNRPRNAPNSSEGDSNKEKYVDGDETPKFGIGTCFGVTNDGYIVTNDHVIDGAKEIAIRTSDKEFHEAKIISKTASTDLAVLKIDTEKTPFLPLASSRTVTKGDGVFTMGFPVADMLGTEPKYTDGVVSAKSGLGDDPLAYQITVPIHPGNSGGPLVNEKGQVIGVITSTAAPLKFMENAGTMPQNINWAVKSDYLMPLLENYSDNAYESRKEAINAVEKAVCMVITRS